MITIVLYGKYRRKYGKEFTLAVDGIQQAINLICANFKGMAEEIRQDAFHIWVGKPTKGINLNEESIGLLFPENSKVHLIPAVKGQSNNNVFKALGMIVAGALLFGLGMGWFGGAFMGKFATNLGISLMLGGAAALLSPKPQTQKDAEEESFMFQGSTNVYAQGVPIPVVYGEVYTGSVVAAASIFTEEIPTDDDEEEEEEEKAYNGELSITPKTTKNRYPRVATTEPYNKTFEFIHDGPPSNKFRLCRITYKGETEYAEVLTTVSVSATSNFPLPSNYQRLTVIDPADSKKWLVKIDVLKSLYSNFVVKVVKKSSAATPAGETDPGVGAI